MTKFNSNSSSSSCVDCVSCNIYSRTIDGLHSTIEANTSSAACFVVESSRFYTYENIYNSIYIFYINNLQALFELHLEYHD